MTRPVEAVWTRVICKQPGRYIGWPTITRTRTGELLAVFSGDREEHICPWGKTHLVRSSDDGDTWSAPQIIRDSPIDDRDAGIIETARATILVSWFSAASFESNPAYRDYGTTLTTETREQYLGNWVLRSEDGGRTWGDPIRVNASAPHGPVQLRDGRILYLGVGKIDGERAIVAEESTDDGRTWNVIGTVNHPPATAHRGLGEPHLVETATGKLVGLFRVGGDHMSERFLYQADSDDGGRTWTPARLTPMLGFPPHLTRLQDDRLLVVYGRRLDPFGQRACLSDDEGVTWDSKNERVMQAAPNDDLGDPASAQLADESIVTVYYQVHEPGEKTCLMATRWRL
ncbi:MAG: sialidase family protein [Candidatus Latescibacterota bacterium]|nr:sialidase family protein [Candidatus Latescibacterota bacterium]